MTKFTNYIFSTFDIRVLMKNYGDEWYDKSHYFCVWQQMETETKSQGLKGT